MGDIPGIIQLRQTRFRCEPGHQKMRIALLTQVVPFPPDSGPKIKTHSVLQYLARRHEVHLVSFVRTPEERASAEALGRLCRSVTTVPLRRSRLKDVGYLLRSMVNGQPFLIERDDVAAMHAAVGRVIRDHRIEAVHADQLSMAQYAVDAPVGLRVLDEHNAVWTIVRRAAQRERPGVKRILAEIEWRKLKTYERDVCRRFDRVTVVSQDDQAALVGTSEDASRFTIVPIAIDSTALAYLPRSPQARDIVSVATMFYPPNAAGIYWFASEVFPLIRQELPNSRFLIVGSRPPKRITQLASRDSGIEITGYVADLGPILRQSGVLIVPVHVGSGMRVKILEAFARGIPVVSTSVGVEGIDARNGQHLLVADTPTDFARAVVRMLTEFPEATRIAEASRALVEERYDWRTALSGLASVYASADARQLSDEALLHR